jgi:transketolase
MKNDKEGDLDLIITGSGTELDLCYKASKELSSDLKVRVVSFPCWEAFEAQDKEYQYSVFPPGVPVLSVEALGVSGWEKYAHGSVGMTTFGASGKLEDVFKKFGFSVDNVVEKGRRLVEFYREDRPIPHLLDRPW